MPSRTLQTTSICHIPILSSTSLWTCTLSSSIVCFCWSSEALGCEHQFIMWTISGGGCMLARLHVSVSYFWGYLLLFKDSHLHILFPCTFVPVHYRAS